MFILKMCVLCGLYLFLVLYVKWKNLIKGKTSVFSLGSIVIMTTLLFLQNQTKDVFAHLSSFFYCNLLSLPLWQTYPPMTS